MQVLQLGEVVGLHDKLTILEVHELTSLLLTLALNLDIKAMALAVLYGEDTG